MNKKPRTLQQYLAQTAILHFQDVVTGTTRRTLRSDMGSDFHFPTWWTASGASRPRIESKLTAAGMQAAHKRVGDEKFGLPPPSLRPHLSRSHPPSNARRHAARQCTRPHWPSSFACCSAAKEMPASSTPQHSLCTTQAGKREQAGSRRDCQNGRSPDAHHVTHYPFARRSDSTYIRSPSTTRLPK